MTAAGSVKVGDSMRVHLDFKIFSISFEVERGGWTNLLPPETQEKEPCRAV
jgi:hypothetical protein